MDIDMYTDDLEYGEFVNVKSRDNVIWYNNYFSNLMRCMRYNGIGDLNHAFSNGCFW